jgi:hypothetical protein
MEVGVFVAGDHRANVRRGWIAKFKVGNNIYQAEKGERVNL